MSVYNGGRYLREAVNSILDQTVNDFEIVIVDDGSIDETERILDSFDCSRIVRLRNDTNIGLTRSLNQGLRAASGDYVARHDADDISEPERFVMQRDFLDASPQVAVVGSGHHEIDVRGVIRRYVKPIASDRDIYDHLIYRNCLCHGTTMMRRQAVINVGGYDDELPVAQDWDLWLRLGESHELANLNIPLYRLRITSESVSARHRRLQRSVGIQISEAAVQWRQGHLPKYPPSAQAMARFHVHMAIEALATDNAVVAQKNIVAATACNPHVGDDWPYIAQQVVLRAFEMGEWHRIDVRTEQDAAMGLRFASRMFDLVSDLLLLSRDRRRSAMAELHAAYAFAVSRSGDRAATRKHCLQAWRMDIHQGRNVGMWKTFFGSYSSQPKQ